MFRAIAKPRVSLSDEESSNIGEDLAFQQTSPEEDWNFDQSPQPPGQAEAPNKTSPDSELPTSKPPGSYNDLHPLARMFVDADIGKEENQSLPFLSGIDSKNSGIVRTLSDDPITIDFDVPSPSRARMSQTLNNLPSSFSSSLSSLPSINESANSSAALLPPPSRSKFHSINMTNSIPPIVEGVEVGSPVGRENTTLPDSEAPSIVLRSPHEKEKRNSIDLIIRKQSLTKKASVESQPTEKAALYRNHTGNSSDTKLLSTDRENRPPPRRVMSSFNIVEHEDDGLPLKTLFNKQPESMRGLRYGSESELNQFGKDAKSGSSINRELSARRRTKSLNSEKSSLLVPIQIPNGEGFSPTLLLPPSPSTPNVHRLSNSLALPIRNTSKFRIGPEIRPLNYESLVTYDEVVSELASSMEILERWTEIFEDSLRSFRFPES
ncbi:hypothetical protein K493DRAFT_32530 [Basidiobolus meristosporus CBS 931.73]|uniref:Uncharacterized protein n=1 Tax=Basidiobolus meristosporus CBS 931.73 TaxID=1314790 RepID=A0A1Y1Y7Z2_9FUNG|nr:hypothetical protein K493DRAFT_32530 [Basidiobolus meristosporus CBS 931.73]|eukprot:ORX94088.1 hypothetical protein K493DRAFT_32530 [Basidiobolus meristosporus CBS 931.73]